MAEVIAKTREQLLAELSEAMAKVQAGDMTALKTVQVVSKQLNSEAEQAEKKARDEKQKALAAVTSTVKGLFDGLVAFLTAGVSPSEEAVNAYADKLFELTGKEIDSAEGVWFTDDFGVAPRLSTCRLMKSKSGGEKSTSSTGASGQGKGKKFASTAELLKEHGEEVADEESGKTWNTLYEEAKGNGNAVYQVRIKLAKKLGIA